MTPDPFEIRAQQDFLRGPQAIEVAICRGDLLVTNMTFEDIRHRPITEPTLSGKDGRQFLQAALDCAWAMGLRPAGFHDIPQTVAATQHHLEDMRAIAFGTLNMEKPK